MNGRPNREARNASIGLSPHAFAKTFPFHIACDKALTIIQVGVSLGRMLPDIRAGAPLPDVVAGIRPPGALSAPLLQMHLDQLAIVRHRASGIRLRGQFMPLEAESGWLFIGSPVFANADAIEAAGLTIQDFAPHDAVADMLLFGQTTQIAVSDLKSTSERLGAKHESLRRMEALYRAAIAAANGVAYQELLGEDRFEYVGEGFAALTGYSAEEMRPSALRKLAATGSDENAVAEEEGDTGATGVSYQLAQNSQRRRIEYRFRTKDGQVRWLRDASVGLVDDAGACTGSIGILTDVTTRKEHEQRLGELNEERDAVLGLIPGAVVAFGNAGTVTYCNGAFASLVGKPVSFIQKRTYAELDELLAALCQSDDRPASFASLGAQGSDVIRLSKPANAVIVRSARETRDSNGARIWHVVYLRDATRESEIDRAKTEFLSKAAHELRTPMASVHGFSELLMSQEFDRETIKSIAQTVHRQSSLLVEMVNGLLDLARIEAGRGNDFNLKLEALEPLVRQTCTDLLVPDDARRVVLVSGAGDSALVRVDGGQLRIALTNVLTNAYKYSPEGGEIRAWLATRMHRGREQVGIRVQDEGIGLTPEQLQRVFERFYRANPHGSIPGTGLGMTLVKEIIEAMNGSVDVASEFGRGTVVTLWLPIAVRVEDAWPVPR